MALLNEEDDYNHEDKRSNKQRNIGTCEFVIVVKFGDHVLYHLASSLSNVIRQVDRQSDKNSSLSDFFRIQYLAFGNCLFVLNAIVPRLFCECAFFRVRYS